MTGRDRRPAPRRRARAWLDAPHQPRDRRRASRRGGRRGAAPAPSSAMRPLMDAARARRRREYPVVHLTGTNGKTSAAPHDRGAAGGGRPVGRRRTPAPTSTTSTSAWCGTASRSPTTSSTSCWAPSPTVEDLLPDAPSYFEILTAAALRWFGDVAVDVAVVEVGLGGTGDATNVVDADVAVVTNVEHRPRRVHRPDARRHRGGEGGDRRADVGARARRDRSGARAVLPRRAIRASVAASRHRLRCARATASRIGGRVRRPVHAARASTTTCSSRCTARTRPTTPRSRSRRRSRSSARALDDELVADAFARVRTPGRLEVVGHQPLVLLDGVKNVAGAHALRAALADEFADTPRTLVVGLMREKEPHEMLEALGVRRRGAARVLPTRQPARRSTRTTSPSAALRPRGRARPHRRDRRRRARRWPSRSTSPRPTARSSITGSLYVVSPARAVLVD